MDGHPEWCPQAVWLTRAAIKWEGMLVISVTKFVIFSIIMFLLISAVVIARSSSLQMNPLVHTSSFGGFGQHTLFSSESYCLSLHRVSYHRIFPKPCYRSCCQSFWSPPILPFFDSCLQYLKLAHLSKPKGRPSCLLHCKLFFWLALLSPHQFINVLFLPLTIRNIIHLF